MYIHVLNKNCTLPQLRLDIVDIICGSIMYIISSFGELLKKQLSTLIQLVNYPMIFNTTSY